MSDILKVKFPRCEDLLKIIIAVSLIFYFSCDRGVSGLINLLNTMTILYK